MRSPLGHIVARIAKSNALWHLMVPLAVTLLASTGIGIAFHHVRSPGQLADYWLAGPIWELIAIYLTFFIVLVAGLKKSTDVKVANIAVLRAALQDSTGYFALAATPLEEWFDPAAQAYLSTLFAKHLRTKDYRHQRVLIFPDDASLAAAHHALGTEYQARCFVAIHKEMQIPLAFLRPNQLFELFDGLAPDLVETLGYFPRSHRRHFFGSQSRYFAPNPRTLAFALVYKDDAVDSVILFQKSKQVLELKRLQNAIAMKPFEELANRIRNAVFLSSLQPKPDNDFGSFIEI